MKESEGKQKGISSSVKISLAKTEASVSQIPLKPTSNSALSSLTGGQWESLLFGPWALVHFAATNGLVSRVNIRRACLLRLWQSWLRHRVDICLSLKAY